MGTRATAQEGAEAQASLGYHVGPLFMRFWGYSSVSKARSPRFQPHRGGSGLSFCTQENHGYSAELEASLG